MQVKQFLRNLCNTEINFTGFIDPVSQELQPDHIHTVLAAMNDALTHLYTIFKIKLVKEPVDLSRRSYVVVDLNYIPDLLKIVELRDSYGNEILMNDSFNNTYRVSLLEYNVLELYLNRPMGFVTVIYQANHQEITPENYTKIDLRLPPVLLNVFKYLVIGKVLRSSGNEGNIQLSAMYDQKAEADLQLLHGLDVVNSSNELPRRLANTNWI